MKNLIMNAALAALMGGACVASAAPSEGQWEVDFLANPALAPHGIFHGGSSGQIDDLGALNAGLAGNAATSSLNRLHFNDALRTGEGVSAQFGYAVTRDLVPYVQLHWSNLLGRQVGMGSISSAGLVQPADITTTFGDWRSLELNVGARYYMSDDGPMRPYVEGYVGANRSGTLWADVSSAALQADLGNNELLPAATRFDAGFATGVSYDVSRNADVRFQVGADYIGAQHVMSAAFAPLGINAVAIGDHSWDLNAALGAAVHF